MVGVGGVEAVSGGGPEWFVRAHGAGLLRFAMLLTGSQQRAEDLVQETLTRLLPQWHRVAGAQSPLAYVRRSMVNRFVSERRLMKGRDICVWDVPEAAAGVDVADRVALRRAVSELLAALPARQRAAVVLRFYDDLPDAEIAAVLGCRVATVRSMVSRALGALRSATSSALPEEAR